MKQYLDIVSNVLANGEMKGNRTGTRAITTFGETFRHNMRDGFPLLTTKKVAWKTMAVELEGFIKGITDKQWYQERRCRIWNEWANPAAVDKMPTEEAFLNPLSGFWDDKPISREENQKKCMDLGPIYGYQWRSFNKPYNGTSDGDEFNFTDQLHTVIHRLKTNPDDRRMVVSAWNPNQMYWMALPPCHYSYCLVHINGKLNLEWNQRSADAALGIPFNIASYALLLHLICKTVGLEPGVIKGNFSDCHIYENHVSGLLEQISRQPHELPNVVIEPTEEDGSFDIFNWAANNLNFENYNHHPSIKFDIAV